MPAKEPMKASQLGTSRWKALPTTTPTKQLDQRDRDPDLDRDRRGEKDRPREERCYRDVAHGLYLRVERQW